MSDTAEPLLVTGGSGFLGRALLRRLVSNGRTVRALVRSRESARVVEELGAEPVEGDVRDRAGLDEAMSGSGVVYHVAGLNAVCMRDPSALFAVNVDGSRNVVAAAAQTGVNRVVYTSSAATLGERRGTVGNEESLHRGFFLSDYERSKYYAERAALELGSDLGVDVVSVNPSSVQGPGRTSGTARIFILFLSGRLRFFIDTRVSLIDIDDCTEGHVLAERFGRPGERYVLSGSVLTAREALHIAAALSGVSSPARPVPASVALLAGWAAELAKFRHRHPPICREVVRTLLHGHAYDGSKAQRELGLHYTPVEQTLRRTADWLRAEGIV